MVTLVYKNISGEEIMRKLPLIIIFCLICSLILPPSALGANTEYDHEALMEYEGYGQAIYETLVEETAYITGQYTNNKEYVNKSVDQLKDYAKFWWDEQKLDSDPLTYERFKEVVAKPVGYFLTVGDWFKKMFGGYEEKYYPPVVNDYSKYVTLNKRCPTVEAYCGNFIVNTGYVLVFSNNKKATYSDGYIDFQWFVSGKLDGSGYGRLLIGDGWIYDGQTINMSAGVFNAFFKNRASYEYINGDFGRAVQVMSVFGLFAHFETDDGVIIKDNNPNDDFDRFKKYLDDKLNTIATPQPKPYLVCPNGTKIQMSVSGSTFLNSDGTVTVVNKDGTAQVDNVTCQLGWEKPEVKYIEDRAAIQTPDGKWQDAETGKAVVEKEPEKPTEPSNPSCNDSDNMEVDSGQCEGVPYFGSKLEFIFGNATGNKNHIERSLAMELQLNSIGIFDDAKGKKLVLDNLSNAFDDPSSIRETQENGRVVRTSVLKGPNGELKVESVWDKEKLISVKLGEDVEEEPGDGTVWKYINITQPFYDGTKIPKSFELEADGEKFWVHPNGTKHMVEYITRDATTHGMPINSQTLLTSFHNSVIGAVKEGIKYEEIMNIGNWELIFSKPREDGLLPVIKHAVYMP